MKRIARILGVPVICGLALTQCEGILDTAPMGELNSEVYYQTEEDFETASLSPYSTLLNFYYDQFGLGWFQGLLYPDDDVRQGHGGNNPQVEFNWRADNGHFSYLWSESYKGIMRANVILDQLPRAQRFADERNKARYEAEARYLRAYFNFLLARTFGTPPVVPQLINAVADSRLPNSQPGEIWDLIESDLAFAAANLPESWNGANAGRATRYAALALLGKARLFRAQWLAQPAKYQEAIQALEPVVASGRFRLMDDYGDNFRESHQNNAESLFEIQMTRGEFNPWLPVDYPGGVGAAGSGRVIFTGAGCGPTGVCAPGANSYGYGQVHVTEGLRNAFENGDPRRFYTLFSAGEDYVGTPYDPAWSVTGSTPAKYVRQSMDLTIFPPNITTNNERVIRYADVLLMLAEAKLLDNSDAAGAAALVNQVRQRARNTYEILHGQPAPPGLLQDKATVTHADIRQERRVEFALEVHRYDDLVRWHRAGLIDIRTEIDFGNSIANQNWSEVNLLKPIPQRELDNNPNLSQNTGY